MLSINSTNFDLPEPESTRKIYVTPTAPDQNYYDPIFTRKIFIILIMIAIVALVTYGAVLDAGILTI